MSCVSRIPQDGRQCFIINVLLYKIRHLCDWEFDIALFTDLANQGIRRLVIGWLVDYMSRGTPCLCSRQARPKAAWKNKPFCGTGDCHSLVRKDNFDRQLAVRQTDRGKIGVTLNANIRMRDVRWTRHNGMTVMLQYWIRYASKRDSKRMFYV